MSSDRLSELISEVSDGGLLANHIVIAEVMTDDGLDLRVAGSSSLTPWQALGMLEMAKEVIFDGDEE
jgi:hypothetical protein